MQSGIATILMVMLVGIGVTATAFGVMHGMRSTQEKQIATHAITHAQAGLWTGVEALRRYLGEIDDTALTELNGTVSLPIALSSGGFGSLTAKNITVSTTGGVHRVSAQIVNNHTDAKSTATVGVVFEVNPSDCASCVVLSAALDFHDDLRGTNDINFDQPVTINVDGDINFSNIDITSLTALNATGSITLNSSVDVSAIRSNGDVSISKSTVGTIFSKGNVTLATEAQADVIKADGNINLLNEFGTQSVQSRSNITVGGETGNHTLISAGGSVEVQANAGAKYANNINSLHSVGKVTVASDAAQINAIKSENDLACPLASWTGFGQIDLSGVLDPSCADIIAALALQDPTDANRPIKVSSSVNVDVVAPVQPFAMPILEVDVFKLKQDANYVVSYDGTNISVAVFNINGEVDGTVYKVGRHSSGKLDALCETVVSGNCTCSGAGCTIPEKYLCLGYALAENCIEYSGGTFTLSGTGIAPGIWWIDGNVSSVNGFNNATLLATGNITSTGHYRGAAVNYGAEPPNYDLEGRDKSLRTTPYQEICDVAGSGLQEAASHMISDYHNRFVDRYPSNLCDKATTTYFPIPTGNIALAAGGIRPVADGGDGTTYLGGDISLGANTQVYGITLAGGYFESRDNAAYFGYVLSAAQGVLRATGAEKNLLSGNTRVILDSESEFYSPNETTNMGSAPPCSGAGCPPTSTEKSKLLWSRYQ